MGKINVELLKKLHMNDIVGITKKMSSTTEIKLKYRVKEPTEYSLIIQHPVTRDVTPLRWKDYGTEWVVTEIEVINPLTEIESCKEQNVLAVPEETPVQETSPSPTEQTAPTPPQKAVLSKPSDKKVDTNTKTSAAQLNAVKKYTDKFERINCRFEKGTLEKIRESGYEGSNNQFIVNCVLEKLGQPIQQPIKKEKAAASKESKVTPLPNKKAFCEGIYNSIIDDIETQEAFTGEPLDVNSIIEIVKAHLTV